jgi:hypothetical protein
MRIMPVAYEPHPERFRSTGIVYLAFNDEDGNYAGYWDLGEQSPVALEDFPRNPSAAAAVAWGRERTPRVQPSYFEANSICTLLRPCKTRSTGSWFVVNPSS